MQCLSLTTRPSRFASSVSHPVAQHLHSRRAPGRELPL
jgi:hypothetical protein